MYWGRIAMKINMNAGRTHTYNSKCVINCCCVSFECHWVSKGCTLGKGLGWKGGQDWHTYSNWIHKLKQRLWRASSSWEKVSKIVHHKDIPCLLTCTVHVHWIWESSNECHIQNSHNTKPGLNLWIMEYLTTNLQIIKKKITSKYTTFFFRNTDSSMSPVKDGPSGTDAAFCQHWAGVWVQGSHLVILTALWNLTGSYARLVGEVFRAGEG